jgi:hypothetical protein
MVRTYERQLPKLNVEGSNPFGRSKPDARPCTHVRAGARLTRDSVGRASSRARGAKRLRSAGTCAHVTLEGISGGCRWDSKMS